MGNHRRRADGICLIGKSPRPAISGIPTGVGEDGLTGNSGASAPKALYFRAIVVTHRLEWSMGFRHVDDDSHRLHAISIRSKGPVDSGSDLSMVPQLPWSFLISRNSFDVYGRNA